MWVSSPNSSSQEVTMIENDPIPQYYMVKMNDGKLSVYYFKTMRWEKWRVWKRAQPPVNEVEKQYSCENPNKLDL